MARTEVDTQSSRAAQARSSAAKNTQTKSTQRRGSKKPSYIDQNRAKEKTGAAVPRSKQVPEELKGNQVRARG